MRLTICLLHKVGGKDWGVDWKDHENGVHGNTEKCCEIWKRGLGTVGLTH